MSEQINEQQQPLFSSKRQFKVPVLSGTRKVVTVRFPTDAEWCERARKQRSLRKFLGRGKSVARDLDSSVANEALFTKIRLDQDGPAFTAAEAANVLQKLERASVESSDREGDNFRIELRVPGALTTHFVRMPSREEMDRHEAASVDLVSQRRAQEIRGFLEPSGELYDAIRKSVEGYDGEPPIVHKVAIVSEVLAQLVAEDEEAIPE